MNPSGVGSKTEGIVLAALLRADRTILLPFGSGHKYDMAIDDSGKLLRVQCKTAAYKNGCVLFNTASQNRAHKWISYVGFVDMFGVYCAALDTVYLVPIEAVKERQGRLRIESAKNNQSIGVRWAKEYQL